MPAPATITPSGGCYVGATVALYARLYAADGAAITGGANSLTCRVRHEDASSSTSFEGTGDGITEEGGGLYSLAWAPNAEGWWDVTWLYDGPSDGVTAARIYVSGVTA